MNTNLISFVSMQILCNTDIFKSMLTLSIGFFNELYFKGLIIAMEIKMQRSTLQILGFQTKSCESKFILRITEYEGDTIFLTLKTEMLLKANDRKQHFCVLQQLLCYIIH